ncbi:MAG: hypothetical protein KFF77_01740 [Bacteroidetes bacterium]|nr:hypothetical protein [Bacteroidota bacterium]
MKLFCTVVLAAFFAASPLLAQEEGFAGRPITSNLSMPTGNTLHAGEFSIGIGPVEYGITENIQIGTNLLLFIFQYYNADLKVSLIDTEKQALALGVGVGYFDLGFVGGDLSFTSISPYAAYSFPIASKTRMHLGANFTIFEGDGEIGEAEDLNASVTGTSVAAGIEHSLSNKTKFVGDVGYDIEFEGVRVGGGVLWGWEIFRLKLGLQYFSPKGYDGYIFPYVGLWWRFRG